MARNRQVGEFQRQMWLGFTGFIAVMAVISTIGTVIMGIPVDPVALIFTLVMVTIFTYLLLRYLRDR